MLEDYLEHHPKIIEHTLRNVFFLGLLIILLDLFTPIIVSNFLNIDLLNVVTIVSFFCWLFFKLKQINNKFVYKNKEIILLIFLIFQLIISFYSANFKLNYFNLFSLSIFSITLIFYFLYFNNTNKKTTNENDFLYYIEKKLSFPLLLVIFIIFISIRLYFIISGKGFIDEFFHIGAALPLISGESIGQFYFNEAYMRGLHLTSIIYIFLLAFGKNYFAISIIPLIVSILNFILLFKISKIFFKKNKLIIFLLILYSISFLSIFSHIYIRPFVFLEFFFLLNIFIFIKLINTKNLIYVILITTILIFNFIFDHGSTFNILAFQCLFFLIFYYSILIKNNKKIFYFFLSMLLIIAIIIFNITSGNIEYYSNIENNFLNFFFMHSVALTILAFYFSKALNKDNKSKLFIFSFFLIFFLFNILLPNNFQILRGIIYFFPIFLLVSVISIENLRSKLNKKFFYLILFIIFFQFLVITPVNFIKTPYLPEEINFMDLEIFEDVKDFCEGAVIITGARPVVPIFFNIDVNYHINTYLEDNYNWKNESNESDLYFFENDAWFEVNTKTPVITSINELLEIEKYYDVCIIYGGLPQKWINSATTDHIFNNYSEIEKEYLSNYSFRRFRLLRKNIS